MRHVEGSEKSGPNAPVPLYLHIPKCGGSTIISVIYQQCGSSIRDHDRIKYWHRGVYFYPAGLFRRPSFRNPDVVKMLNRGDLTAVVGHFVFGIHKHVNKPFRYVTVLRSPVSRLLSLHDELKAQNRIRTTFEKFILAPPFRTMENDQTRRISGLQPVKQADGELMLESAKKNLETHFGVVGITERMNETLCLIHRTFSWNRYYPYYPKNVTWKRTNPDSISSDLMQLIADRNSLDFRLYRFAEQLLEKAIRAEGPEFQHDLKQYNESIQNLVNQTDIESIDSMDSKKVHQIVLDMINKGKIR